MLDAFNPQAYPPQPEAAARPLSGTGVQTLLSTEKGREKQVANTEEGKRKKGGVEKESSQQRG
jgi:hypothetical protein